MSDCPVVEELAAFVAGKAPDTAAIDEHLAECSACRKAVVLLASAEPNERAPEPALVPGARFGRYTVLEAVGAGSMGVVYAAYDGSLDRKVALKVLRQTRLGVTSEHRLLFREARALARLSNDNVVQVFEVGEVAGREFVAMEFVAGETLGAWIARERPTPAAIVDVLVAAARGLSAAHAAGLVHRDFKPDNVLLARDGARLQVKVADFGLAHGLVADPQPPKSGGAASDGRVSTDSGHVRAELTTLGSRGALVGTPAYMAPEQAGGRAIDARADQYAFAVVLYEALSGERPHTAAELASLLAQKSDPTFAIATSSLPLPARARRALQRSLSPDPDARFPSLDELVLELRPPAPPRSSRRAWVGLGGGVVLLSAVVAWSALRTERPDPCVAAAERARERFGPERKETIRAAFHATGLPYADDAWKQVEVRVDQQLEAWTEARTAVCAERPREGESQLADLRTSCLQSNLLYTNAFLDTLDHANGEVVERAVLAAYELPSVSACDDYDALVNRGAPAPSSSIRARYDELEGALAHSSAASRAGDYAAAAEEASRVTQDAEALGDKPLLGRSLLLAGSTQEQLGKFESARKDYERSALVALAGRDDVGALAAIAELVPILAYRFADAQAAEQWAKQGTALAERLGERGHPYDAALLKGRGIAAYARGDYQGAKGFYEEALALLDRRGAGEGPEAASIALKLAQTERYRGAYDLADRAIDRALSLRIRLFGEKHPLVADVRTEMGVLFATSGRIDEAHRALEEALAVQVAALGPDHIEVAYTINRLANLELAWGQLDEALLKFRRVLAMGRAALGEHNPEVGMAHHNIAECLTRMGRLDEAEAEEREADRIVESTVGREHSFMAMITNGFAVLKRLRGEPREAAELHARALVIVEKTVGKEHVDAADLAIELGRDAMAAGDDAEALKRFAQGAAGRPPEGAHPLDVVALELDWAEAALRSGDHALFASKLGAARARLDALSTSGSLPRTRALSARADELSRGAAPTSPGRRADTSSRVVEGDAKKKPKDRAPPRQ